MVKCVEIARKRPIPPKGKPQGSHRPKKNALVLKVRLVLRDMRMTPAGCEITVFNEGNMPCFNGRAELYRSGLGMFPRVNGAPERSAGAAFSLGVQEEKVITLRTAPGAWILRTYTAIVFDPILDPFPTSRVGELDWMDTDILHHGTGYWIQRHYRDDFHFSSGAVVPEGQRSWTYQPIAQHGSNVPAGDGAPRYIYFPVTPPRISAQSTGVNSELIQEVDLSGHPNSALLDQESAKGNVSAMLQCLLYNYDQQPRDMGGLAIEARLNDSPVDHFPQPLPLTQAYSSWTAVSVAAGGGVRFNRVVARLCAKRNTGQNSDSYFGDVRCILKHRQAKRARFVALQPLLPTLP